MRRVLLALALLASLGAAQSAFAAPMNFTATLTVRIPEWDGLGSNSPLNDATWTRTINGMWARGTTVTTTVDVIVAGADNSFALPMLTFLLQDETSFFTLTGANAGNAVSMDVNANMTGNFTGNGGGSGVFGGQMGLPWNFLLTTVALASAGFSDPVIGLNTTASPNTGDIDATIVAQGFAATADSTLR